MNADFRRFARRLVLFALPFLAYAGVIAMVDPYELFGTGGPVDRGLKQETSFKLNYALWKILAFRRAPAAHILLGDSRMMGLPEDLVAAETGRPVANLAYGGGSLREAIDTFWLADAATDLERVSLGIGFNMYSAANDKNRVLEVERILENPLLYFINLNVVQAAGSIVRAEITGEPPAIGKPQDDPDAFWRHQIDVVTRAYYESWREPKGYLAELKRIADHCREKGIRLEIIIPPGHADLQQAVARFGLTEQYARFKRDLAGLAPIYDFDIRNGYTADASNFSDPYHPTPAAKREVIRGVWGTGSKFVHAFGPASAVRSGNPQHGES